MDLVSIVIPCYNPEEFLLEAVASARAQAYAPIEIVLVNDGTTSAKGREVLKAAAQKVDRYIEQPNRGLAAARNAGFSAARGRYIVPLDSDDLLEPGFVSEYLQALRQSPDAAFVYSDYRVFGDRNYVERLPDYNLYDLLDQNTIHYFCLIPKQEWEAAGGYGEVMRPAYEDWEFWLRLGARERFGRHIEKVLFRYRKHGPSLFDQGRARHEELTALIRSRLPELYSYEGRASVKAQWSPAVDVTGSREICGQTILDCRAVERVGITGRPAACVLGAAGKALDSHSAEVAALAVWGGHERFELPDGSVAVRQEPAAVKRRQAFEVLQRHFVNAGLWSIGAWLRHPLRSAGRLIPLGVKERLNRATGRQLFDLRFYLQFQPRAVLLAGSVVEPLRYMPKPAARRRAAFVTSNLGAIEAQRAFLELVKSLDRVRDEIFAIATDTSSDAVPQVWIENADHVYDLPRFVKPERMSAAVYSMFVNWRYEVCVIYDSAAAKSIEQELKQATHSRGSPT